MAIDNINELDKLNTGRIKLNQAIDKANTVQGQLDTIIIDSGTSDAETIQARGGEPLLYNRLDKVDTQLADNAISPDQFIGTDFSKLQQAINYAIANNKSIRFSRMYDITGLGILNIDKTGIGRKTTYFLGVGGGIIKNDSGYIFTSLATGLVGDIVSDKMKYESVSNGSTVVWNGNKIIRLTSIADCYINVDGVFEANSTYAQSVSFFKFTITGGQGWAFEWKKSYDVTIEGLIEHRQHGIRNTSFTGNPDNDNLRIVNSVIEGLTGKAMELGSSFAVLIQGNYMELNAGGYIGLSQSANFHNGLTIIGNSFQPSQTQIDTNIPGIDLGKIGSNGAFSSGNSAIGVLYNLTEGGNAGRLSSIGDISYNGNKVIGSTSLLSDLGKITTLSNGNSYGSISKKKYIATGVIFIAGESKDVTINTDLTLTTSDIISIGSSLPTGNWDFTIQNWRKSGTSDIIVRIRNDSTGAQTLTPFAIILQIK